jgi:hypothetical protein
LSVEADTVTRFWLHAGVGDGVGVGAGAEDDGDAWLDGAADAVAPAAGSVDEACSELPLKAPAREKPPTTSAITSSRAAPRNSRRRRYTAGLGLRTVLDPDAVVLPRDDSPCPPILLG